MRACFRWPVREGNLVKRERAFARLKSESARPVFEETFRPSAGCHGGVFTQPQNYQCRLRIVCVSGCFGFVLILGHNFSKGRGFYFGHAAKNILATTGGPVT